MLARIHPKGIRHEPTESFYWKALCKIRQFINVYCHKRRRAILKCSIQQSSSFKLRLRTTNLTTLSFFTTSIDFILKLYCGRTVCLHCSSVLKSKFSCSLLTDYVPFGTCGLLKLSGTHKTLLFYRRARILKFYELIWTSFMYELYRTFMNFKFLFELHNYDIDQLIAHQSVHGNGWLLFVCLNGWVCGMPVADLHIASAN